MADKKVSAEQSTEEQQAAVKDAQEAQGKEVIVENDTGSDLNATDAAHAGTAEDVQEKAREIVQQDEDAEGQVISEDEVAPKLVTPDDFYRAGFDSIALHAGGIAYVSPFGLELLRSGSGSEAGKLIDKTSGETDGKASAKSSIEPVELLKSGATVKEVTEAFNGLAEKFNQLLSGK
ncbi:gp090 [Erwinia phage vB_EamP-S6]|uniref:Gp090 n=1 Tax=Erwinia phage vB_EamP-S6 TaxID=1051675 RepID=G0YQI2_9CAUD|nr:gp090 [Erwinia phage vB_EamP-S6]AEJ81609.1 gp090 [Erwinia phage vB_EamP-S6]